MTASINTPLVVVELFSACVWVGSMVSLAVVANAARKVLDAPNQVRFFRAVGQRYAVVGTASLLVAIGAGLWLAWPPRTWSETFDAAVALAGLLGVATASGMAQARAMTRMRRRSIAAPDDAAAAQAVRRGRRVAGVLRGLMGAITAAIVILAALTVSH